MNTGAVELNPSCKYCSKEKDWVYVWYSFSKICWRKVFLLIYRLHISFRLEKILADLDVAVGRRPMQRSSTLAEYKELKRWNQMKTNGKHFQGRTLITCFLNVNQHLNQRENDKLGHYHSCKSSVEEYHGHWIQGITMFCLNPALKRYYEVSIFKNMLRGGHIPVSEVLPVFWFQISPGLN